MRFDVVALAKSMLTSLLVDLAGDPTFSIPARQYVTGGLVAFDCEQLTVSGMQITAGLGGSAGLSRTREDVTYSVQFDVTVVRCMPAPEDINIAVPAADLDAAGSAILNDGGALLRAALSAWMRGALLPGCSDIIIGPVAWGTPDGMLVGTTLTIHAQMG